MTVKGKIRFIQGNQAIAQGALAAGARFFAGYPITPSSETVEISFRRLLEFGGVCIQLQDEELVLKKDARTIAFPSISTGVYRFPVDKVASVVCQAVKEIMGKHQPQKFEKVCFYALTIRSIKRTLTCSLFGL
jgi:hypothetical protein